jgi:hypothetical protein
MDVRVDSRQITGKPEGNPQLAISDQRLIELFRSVYVFAKLPYNGFSEM